MLDLQLRRTSLFVFRVLSVYLVLLCFGGFVFPRASGVDSVLGLTFWFGYFGRGL